MTRRGRHARARARGCRTCLRRCSLRLRHRCAQGAGRAHHRPARKTGRAAYCGAGPVAASPPVAALHATFNVPIRTVELWAKRGLLRHWQRHRLAPTPTPNGEWAASAPLSSAPVSFLTCWKPCGWRTVPTTTRPSTWRAWSRRRRISACPGTPPPCTSARRCWRAATRGAWRTRLLPGAAGTPRAEAFALAPTPELVVAPGAAPAGPGARRIRAPQDHAPRALRRVCAPGAGRVRHRAVERGRRDHRRHLSATSPCCSMAAGSRRSPGLLPGVAAPWRCAMAG